MDHPPALPDTHLFYGLPIEDDKRPPVAVLVNAPYQVVVFRAEERIAIGVQMPKAICVVTGIAAS